jgi:hypothetical protein
MSESVHLKVTSAFLIGGEIAKTGEIVEVTTAEARDLLQRGKAVLADAEDAPKVAPKVGLSVGDTKSEDEGEEKPAGEETADAEEPAKRGKGKK